MIYPYCKHYGNVILYEILVAYNCAKFLPFKSYDRNQNLNKYFYRETERSAILIRFLPNSVIQV